MNDLRLRIQCLIKDRFFLDILIVEKGEFGFISDHSLDDDPVFVFLKIDEPAVPGKQTMIYLSLIDK